MSNEYFENLFYLIRNSEKDNATKRIITDVVRITKKMRGEDTKKLEDIAYATKGRTLTDKERISYELDKIDSMSLLVDDYNLYQAIIKSVRHSNSTTAYEDDLDTLNDNKLKIITMQVSLGIMPYFFSVFNEFVKIIPDEVAVSKQEATK